MFPECSLTYRFDTIVAMDKKNVRDIKTAVKEWAEDPANRIEVPAAMKKVQSRDRSLSISSKSSYIMC